MREELAPQASEFSPHTSLPRRIFIENKVGGGARLLLGGAGGDWSVGSMSN